MTHDYVHGYTRHERVRLRDQGNVLVDLIHRDTSYPAGSVVLEVGCGVGVQTLVLARRNPEATFVAIDRSEASLAIARRAIKTERLRNVEFISADILSLPFAARTFDHIFVCFVLEHLADPRRALVSMQRCLKRGGTVTAIEGDHGSTLFHPESVAARHTIQCQVTLQARAGGNAGIGRQLYPVMVGAGLRHVRVDPRMVYVDASRPDLVDGFTKKTFIALVAGIRTRAIAANLTTPRRFDAGVRALNRTTRADGVFCYTFFKGVGAKANR